MSRTVAGDRKPGSPGRPRLRDELVRTERMHVALSVAEFRKVWHAANRKGRPTSVWAREALLKAARCAR